MESTLLSELATIRDTLAKLTNLEWNEAPKYNSAQARMRCLATSEGYRCDNNTRSVDGYCSEHEDQAQQEELPMPNARGRLINCRKPHCSNKTIQQNAFCVQCNALPPDGDTIKLTTLAIVIFATSLRPETKENIAADVAELLKDVLPKFNYDLFIKIATKGTP